QSVAERALYPTTHLRMSATRGLIHVSRDRFAGTPRPSPQKGRVMERNTDVVTDDDATDAEVVRRSHTPTWSPAQIIGLIVGIGFIVLGVAALAKTGFDPSHVDQPHDVVWHFAHSPLLGAIEVAYGALLVIASVVPGASRTLMALLGAIGVAFGLVVLIVTEPN